MGLPQAVASMRAGKQQAKPLLQAAQIAADSQREGMEYLKEREALPMQYRDKAIEQLGSDYLGGAKHYGDVGVDVEGLKDTPLYQAIMGGMQTGEESIMRNASATGGLRSGNVQENLAEFGGNLERTALLDSYGQQYQENMVNRNNLFQEDQANKGGLASLAGLQSYAPQISQQIGNIGMTQAQGVAGAGAARAKAMYTAGEVASGSEAMVASIFSDIRLKTSIKPIGKRNGQNWYSWTWNKQAEMLGLIGESEGVMAHEIVKTHPDLITEKDGYLQVNYEGLENE